MSPTSRVSSHRKNQILYPGVQKNEQVQQNQQYPQFQNKNHSPIYPIMEQDTTQEISSIDPHGISAQQRAERNQNGYYVTVNNNESQYVFTSQ